jgi:hypothetical protein
MLTFMFALLSSVAYERCDWTAPGDRRCSLPAGHRGNHRFIRAPSSRAERWFAWLNDDRKRWTRTRNAIMGFQALVVILVGLVLVLAFVWVFIIGTSGWGP